MTDQYIGRERRRRPPVEITKRAVLLSFSALGALFVIQGLLLGCQNRDTARVGRENRRIAIENRHLIVDVRKAQADLRQALMERRRLALAGEQAHNALCVLKGDYQTRLERSRRFLKENPNGVDGITPALIQQGIAQAQTTLDSLAGLECV